MEGRKSEHQPPVSIIIPVYNGSDYLKDAIDSALSQTYPNLEVIVVNDGSCDGGATEKIAASYGDKIRYFKKENGGVSSALNLGIRHMEGEYFSWLSHDDLYKPEKIAHQVELIGTVREEKIIAMCRCDLVDKDARLIKQASVKGIYHGQVFKWEKALIKLIHDGSFIGCDLLIPKKAFEESGLFDESLRYVQDFMMWMQIFLHGYSLVVSTDADVQMRVHQNQLTQTARDLFLKESVTLCSILLPQLAQESTGENNFVYYYTLYNAKYNNTEVVHRCMLEADRRSLFSGVQRIKAYGYIALGKFRPTLRKIYYRVFRNIKT